MLQVWLEFVSDLFYYLIRTKNCSLLIIKGIKEGCIKFLCSEKTANSDQEASNYIHSLLCVFSTVISEGECLSEDER